MIDYIPYLAFSDMLREQQVCFIWHINHCSKISNIFLLLLSNKVLLFRAGIYKMLVRIANRQDPSQAVSLEAVWSGLGLYCLLRHFGR